MNDSRTLHFLKNFPGWIVLSILFVLVLWVYLTTERQFLERIIDTILGGLLAILTGRAVQAQTGNTGTGDVNILPASDNLAGGEKPVENIKEEQ